MAKPVNPFEALEGINFHEGPSVLGGLEKSDYWIIAALKQLLTGGTAPDGVEVALGNVPGYDYGTGQARATGVNIAGAPQDVTLNGGFYNGFSPSVPVPVRLVSGSVSDAALGVGMRTATIHGLKTATSTTYETEVLTIGGADSINDWYRVNNIVGLTYGSANINEGLIRCLNAPGEAWEFSRITIGDGQSLRPVFTVPFGKRMAIYDKIMTTTRASGTDGSATVSLRAKLGGDAEHAIRVYDFTNESPVLGAGDIIVLPALTDIIWRVDEVGVDDTTVNITFPYVVVDEAVVL